MVPSDPGYFRSLLEMLDFAVEYGVVAGVMTAGYGLAVGLIGGAVGLVAVVMISRVC